MANPTEILRFFHPLNSISPDKRVTPKSLNDFLKAFPSFPRNLISLHAIINKLEHEGLLKKVSSISNDPITGDRYYSTIKLGSDLEDYGTFNFLSLGFQEIYSHFKPSILPIEVKREHLPPDIGTFFICQPSILITARHCLPKDSLIILPNWKSISQLMNAIILPNDDRIDLAFMVFLSNPYPNSPCLRFGTGLVLDEVITIGYPPFKGFDSVQIADIGKIAGQLKGTTGNLVGLENSYLDSQDYFLLSSKVKGGNSGGPVIDRLGLVVGLVSSIPSEEPEVYDSLGYGLAIPSKTICPFLEEISTGSFSNCHQIDFDILNEGFKAIL